MSIESEIGERLGRLGATMATAESCAGGLISHRITNVPGASAYFQGGFITYSNRAKMKLLGVGKDTLNTAGAVSEEVAREMAQGAQAKLGVDFAVSVTGIAGPTGGTEEKPVGTVYIGVATPSGARVERKQFSGTREEVKSQTAQRALEFLLECIDS